MGRKPKIATEMEVLSFLTDVMRRDTPEDVKISEAMSAADKLIKYYKENVTDSDKKETGVVILPEIRKDDKNDNKTT